MTIVLNLVGLILISNGVRKHEQAVEIFMRIIL